MNNTTTTPTNSSADYGEPYNFHTLAFIFLLGMAMLSVATVMSNGLFLWTFYKDPLKCLRTPSAIFIAGLTSANFLTGLIVEPAIVFAVALSFYNAGGADFDSFYRFVEAFSFVTITSSFLIMLALGIVQYLLIKHPRVYQKAVSPKSALMGVILIFIYSIFFAVLPEMTGMDKLVYYFVDLVVHNTLLTIALVILYTMIFCAFRSFAQRHRNAEFDENTEGQGPSVEQTVSEQECRQAERDFVHGTIILTGILIITVWPLCITMFIAMFKFSSGVLIAWVFTQFLLMWKFALDPLVFAWRLRKYRKSLMLVMQKTCPCIGGKSSVPGATYQRQGSGITMPESEADDDDVQVSVIDGSGPAHQQAAVV